MKRIVRKLLGIILICLGLGVAKLFFLLGIVSYSMSPTPLSLLAGLFYLVVCITPLCLVFSGIRIYLGMINKTTYILFVVGLIPAIFMLYILPWRPF